MSPSLQKEASVFKVRKSKEGERDANFCRKYSKVFCNLLFMLLMVSKSGVNVMTTIFRFFIPKYTAEALGGSAADKPIRTHCFAFIIFFCPYIGTRLSFIFVNAVGGYKKKKAFLICLIFQFLLAAACIPMPLFTNWRHFMVNAFFFQIISSAILPTFGGIAEEVVDKDYKKMATRISKYFATGIFNAISPAAYGLMSVFYFFIYFRITGRILINISKWRCSVLCLFSI